MKKRIYIIMIIVVIIIAIVYGAYSVLSLSYIPAQLHVESGTVTVNNKPVQNIVKLKENDLIETKDGKATVFLYESIVILLEPNTKISILELTQTHPRIDQQQGTTWNQFIKLAGVEGYTIIEGNNRASIRGTGFELSKNKIIAGLGTVDYSFNLNQFSVYEKRVIDNGVERPATPEELTRIEGNIKRSIKQLQILRQKEIDKHPFLVKLVAVSITRKVIETNEQGTIISERKLSKSEIEEYLSRADRGEYNIDEITAKIPMRIGFVQKVADLTKEIQRLQNNPS